jgi:hypothetical protein
MAFSSGKPNDDLSETSTVRHAGKGTDIFGGHETASRYAARVSYPPLRQQLKPVGDPRRRPRRSGHGLLCELQGTHPTSGSRRDGTGPGCSGSGRPADAPRPVVSRSWRREFGVLAYSVDGRQLSNGTPRGGQNRVP